MKKIELIFYRTNPSKKQTGIKHVLVQITDPDGGNIYDWGFCNWDGEKWGNVGEIPALFEVSIHSWANCPNPSALLKDPPKIIPIKGIL